MPSILSFCKSITQIRGPDSPSRLLDYIPFSFLKIFFCRNGRVYTMEECHLARSAVNTLECWLYQRGWCVPTNNLSWCDYARFSLVNPIKGNNLHIKEGAWKTTEVDIFHNRGKDDWSNDSNPRDTTAKIDRSFILKCLDCKLHLPFFLMHYILKIIEGLRQQLNPMTKTEFNRQFLMETN